MKLMPNTYYHIFMAQKLKRRLYSLSPLLSSPLALFQEAIFRVVAAILHLGNIDFAKGKEMDSSVPSDEKSKFHLKTRAELLMYDSF